jgi:hypothetical protein
MAIFRQPSSMLGPLPADLGNGNVHRPSRDNDRRRLGFGRGQFRLGIPVKVNGDSSGSRTAFRRRRTTPERSDAGRLIVPESVRLRQRPSEETRVFRSEAEELRRGFGVQGKGAAAPLSPAYLCRSTNPWRWLPARLSRRRSQTTVSLWGSRRAPLTARVSPRPRLHFLSLPVGCRAHASARRDHKKMVFLSLRQ